MEKNRMRFGMVMAKVFVLLIMGLFLIAVHAEAEMINVRSGVAAAGDTIVVPIDISEEIVDVYGFQFDLMVMPPQDAALLRINDVIKGVAITNISDLDANPLPPTFQGIRIGLPTDLPAVGEPRPAFDGPGAIVNVDFLVPNDAVIGDAYTIQLNGVILAGPDNLAIPVTVLDGTLTIGAATAVANTLSAPAAFSINESETLPLTATVTGAGIPVPGATVFFSIDDPGKASISAGSAVADINGNATIDVTGIEDGSTVIYADSPGLNDVQVAVTVAGISPVITSDPVLDVIQGDTYTYDVDATDPQSQTITFSLLVYPTDMTIDPDTGLITWTPPVGQPQTGNDVTVEARDTENNTDTQSFSIFIANDADGDGYDERVDCDDNNSDIHPGATEIPYDGIDNDCDPATPDDDVDQDGFLSVDDCDDTDPDVNPNATEIPYNEIDDDCNPDTFDYVDNDGDCYLSQQTPAYPDPADCDDNNPDVNPTMTEIRINGLDDDCNPDTRDDWSDTFILSISNDGRVYYAKSNGDGTFGSYDFLLSTGGGNSHGIAVADFDNDGDLDFVAGRVINNVNYYYLYLNDGSDNFSYAGQVGTLSSALSWIMDMTTGDFNNDGYMDVVSNGYWFNVGIYINAGGNQFTQTELNLGNEGRGLDAADFNNDGNLDLVRSTGNGEIKIYSGIGDGTFGSAIDVGNVGSDPYGLTAADFDNDGFIDIIANNGSSGNAYFYKGNGDYSFTDQGYIAPLDVNTFSAYDAYDLNGDGNVDVIVVDYDANAWYFPGNGDGTFGQNVLIGNASYSTLGVSAPPYRMHGIPYAKITPHEQSIPIGGNAILDGSYSHDKEDNGTLTDWTWDFGDGTGGSGETVTHAYGSGIPADEGIYRVQLTVTDNTGLKDPDTARVIVFADPPVADAGPDQTLNETDVVNGVWTVNFDASGSSDDGGIDVYDWDRDHDGITFIPSGDTGVAATHAWNEPGEYTVAVRVTDRARQSDVDTLIVTIVQGNPPVADPGGPYSADEADAVAGEWAFVFDGSGSSDDYGIMTYEWDFDDADGIQVDATGVQPFHFYTTEGTYTITLTVTDQALQTHSATAVVDIDISGTTAPVADPGGPYAVNEESANGGLWTIAFDGSGSFDDVAIERYVWDFGDGSTETTWHPDDVISYLQAGTSLYGYKVSDSDTYLRVIASQDDTYVEIIDLYSGQTMTSRNLNKYEEWTGITLEDNVYFKVESNKPVSAYLTDAGGVAYHSTFIPALDGGPVGRNFIFHYFGYNGFYVYAFEDAVVRAYKTDGSLVAEKAMTGGTYWEPGLSDQVYHFVSTGDIAMQKTGPDSFTTVSPGTGDGVGRTFYCAVYGTGAFSVFSYESSQNADISVYDMDSGSLLFEQTIAPGEYWYKTQVGTRRLRIESTGDVEVWAGDGTTIENLGGDISFAGGKAGREFHIHGLKDGIVIFAPYDGTAIDINGEVHTLDRDEFLRLPGETMYHIDASEPVIIQVLGRAGSYNHLGTYLGGISEINHQYSEAGTYTATLTVYDPAGRSHSESTTVTIGLSDPPVADPGDPYVMDESDAKDGMYIINVDGSGSSDDYGIYTYEWDFGDVDSEAFPGAVIDETKWIVSEDVSQNDMITIIGASAWGSRYCFSEKEYRREGGNVFTVKNRSRNSSPNEIMWGLKNNSDSYAHNQMPYAIVLYETTWQIVEDGANRGNFGNFSRDQWYELKIELKPVKGARYYYRPEGQTEWILLYESNYATRATRFKVGCSVKNGTHDMDDIQVSARGFGMTAVHAYESIGNYVIGLTVTDHAKQSHSASTSLSISPGDSPVADIGGPYTAEPYSYVPFDGRNSTDDAGIAMFEWDFGDGYTGKGSNPQHFYRENGTYTVTLTVYDHLMQSDTDQTTVTVGPGSLPVAEAGGPYQGGVNGPPVFFDGSGSSDDSGILTYTWHLAQMAENFSGTEIDTDDFVFGGSNGGGVSLDSETVVIQGSDSGNPVWGSGYLSKTKVFEREPGIAFYARVLADGQAGNFMIGWIIDGSTYNDGGMFHAFMFTPDNQILIYENGNDRGVFGAYENNQWYDIKIVLKDFGAQYFINGSLTYESDYSNHPALKPAMIAASAQQRTDNWEVEAVINGEKPMYTYSEAGTFPVTLTVTDGMGQADADTGTVEIVDNLPPKVITVPWVGNDPRFPHETWNGKEITLKGVVKDADASTYQWDFGDGATSGILSVSDPYNLFAKHIYPDAPEGTPFVATLTVWDSMGQQGLDTCNIIVKEQTLDTEVNVAIDEALWNLHINQDRSKSETDGRWVFTGTAIPYYASPTASALHAFQINTHLASDDPAENPYAETVSRGMRYLFTTIGATSIGPLSHGDPDTNGNGIGIEVISSQPIYEGGMVMMAIAASGSPLAIARSGADTNGRLYYDILTDMADMYAWGQSANGGWRYDWGDAPDNSASQWAALGMEAAEETFNIIIPGWVKERNLGWLSFSSDGIGWGYQGSGNDIATTPSGLAQLAFDDIPATDWRWINAESYLAGKWSAWYDDTQNYYALYALAKAMRISTPHEITALGKETAWEIDWYAEPRKGVARSVLDDQNPDGSFRLDGQGTYHVDASHLRTAWGVIILSKTLLVKPPVADAGPDRVYGVDWPLTLDGSGSYHTDPFRSIVRYEWDVNGDGIFDYTSASATVNHAYHDLGAYTVTLRVTDDNVPGKTDTDTATVIIAVPPHPPISDPNGPYEGIAGSTVTLDGAGSFDIDPADMIYRYGWELDGIYPYDFDDAVGPNPTYAWETAGTYNIGLKVWDNGVMNDLDDDGELDENERLTDIRWTTVTVGPNTPPMADAGGPYTVDEGVALMLDGSSSSDPDGSTLSFAWDLDNDGEYDDATGEHPEWTWMDNGAYTVGLKVSDGALEHTDSAEVTVTDLGPTAGFSWNPEPQAEGATVDFTDASVSSPDAITVWDWDFGGVGTSTEQSPGFTFNDDGTYTVTLIVTDDDGSIDTVSHDVTITDGIPTAVLTGDTLLDEGQTGNYDASGSTSAPDAIVSYEWDWNYDGITFNPSGDTGVTQTHTWVDNGTYTVAVRVTDDDGSLDVDTLAVTVNNVAPSVDAGIDQTVDVGNTVNFSGSFTDPGAVDTHSYSWDFGDGTPPVTGTLVPTHAYGTEGTFTVTLTVTDDDSGVGTDSSTVQVTSGNVPPVAQIDAVAQTDGPWAGLPDSTVTFDGSSSYDPNSCTTPGDPSCLGDTIISYEWDLDGNGLFNEAGGDDGAPVTPGDYSVVQKYFPVSVSGSVTLRVTDSFGLTDTATNQILTINLFYPVDYNTCFRERYDRFTERRGIVVAFQNQGTATAENTEVTLMDVPTNMTILEDTSFLGTMGPGDVALTACNPGTMSADIEIGTDRRIPPEGDWLWKVEYDVGGTRYIINNIPPLAP